MRHAWGSFVLGLAVCSFPAALSADVVVTTSLNLTSLQFSASGCATCSVQLSSVSASAFGAVFDSLGGSDFGFDPGPSTASTSAATTLANWAGSADATALVASSSSGVNIPDPIAAEAGTVPGGNYGDLQGFLEIMDSSGGTNPVTVGFMAAISGAQDLTTTASGLKATSEVTFNLLVNGTSELFLDNLLQIGPSSMLINPISTTLTSSDNTLLTNTPYFFDANVDAESYGLNAPEPSFIWPTASICLLLLARRFRRRAS